MDPAKPDRLQVPEHLRLRYPPRCAHSEVGHDMWSASLALLSVFAYYIHMLCVTHGVFYFSL